MSIGKGLAGTGKIQARNFTQNEAQKRFDEVIAPIQQMQTNALGVDYHEIEYYSRAQTSSICSCRETEILPDSVTAMTNTDSTPQLSYGNDEDGSDDLVIDWNAPLFGSRFTDREVEDDVMLDDVKASNFGDDRPQHTDNEVVDSLFGDNVDCGICFRTGYAKAFQLVGHMNNVLTTIDMQDTEGYSLDVSQTPHRYEVIDERNNYVEFVSDVPKYFEAVKYSIRDNTSILQDDVLYYNDEPLTEAHCRQFAGKQIAIRVKNINFTHVVLDFKISDNVIANIAQISKSQDWTTFEAIGSLTVVLPITIREPVAGDYIVVLKKNLVLKVTDVQYLRNAAGNNFDWSVTTRVLQPQETAKRISKHRKIF